MNRYPLWKYLLILAIVVPGFIYFLPNLYGEDPAIQVSATRTTKVDATTLVQVEQVLKHAGIDVAASQRDDKGIKVRFRDTDAQLKARDTVQRALGDNYTVALNLLPATPAWFGWINANPMYLGLDLRGGVHFLMQVDMVSALKKAEERYVDDLRSALREKKVRYLTVTRLESGGLEVRFRDVAERDKGREVVRRQLPELGLIDSQKDSEYFLLARLTEQSMTEKRKFALDQNIVALRNRVNELGVAEPVIQQQGIDRIVVQLPGVQDTAKAKEILGRTATLEIMLVDEEHDLTAALSGHVPAGSKLYKDRRGRPILLKKQVIYSGDNIVDAAAGFDSQAGGAVAHITLDARGAAINQRITGESVGKRMAVVYIEIKSETRLDAAGKPLLDAEGRQARSRVRVEEVITAPVIREQIGKRFQITGLDSIEEARDLALLLSGPVRSPRRSRSSKSAPSARASAPRTSSVAFTPPGSDSPPLPYS